MHAPLPEGRLQSYSGGGGAHSNGGAPGVAPGLAWHGAAQAMPAPSMRLAMPGPSMGLGLGCGGPGLGAAYSTGAEAARQLEATAVAAADWLFVSSPDQQAPMPHPHFADSRGPLPPSPAAQQQEQQKQPPEQPVRAEADAGGYSFLELIQQQVLPRP